MAIKAKKTGRSTEEEEVKWPYGKKNYIAFAIALIVIIIGFYTLSAGSITLAPILLVLGYCVLLPVALLLRGDSEEHEQTETGADTPHS